MDRGPLSGALWTWKSMTPSKLAGDTPPDVPHHGHPPCALATPGTSASVAAINNREMRLATGVICFSPSNGAHDSRTSKEAMSKT